ncbi:MAG: hypothetical protein L6243_05520 [Candidatus Altiarchaeales archaeon]|nr:hypothetical protein [Candidatus Altiarchaeota archaeon]MCG2783031.1 hypothetical protein [Candidatus Altiarchaeales archaeon]
MKIYAPLIVIAVLFIGCMGEEPQIGSSSGVTYTCPEGWTITDELDYGGVGHYSACEKDGENSSGVFVLSWFGIEQGLNESLGDMRGTLEEGYGGEGMDVEFSEPEEAVFKGYDALVSDYSLSLEGIDFQGKIIAFNCNEKSVVILSQEAAKDHDEYLADFERIGNSVECGVS